MLTRAVQLDGRIVQISLSSDVDVGAVFVRGVNADLRAPGNPAFAGDEEAEVSG